MTPAGGRRAARGAAAGKRARSSFAKTTMPDYGMLSSGLSSHHPLARNPWKLDRNPGGSSAGAGAAAAALYGPCHVGTDIGGSIRLPAGWCGIVGLKPTAGRVPIDPPYIGRVAGPMTRDVADAALMMATLALPDARDYTSLQIRAAGLGDPPGAARGPEDRAAHGGGLRRSADAAKCSAAVERAARDFEAAGARVEPLAPFLTQEMLDGLDHFWRTRALIDLERAGAGEARARAAVHPRLGGIGGQVFGRRGFSRLQPDPGDAARRRSRRRCLSTMCCRRLRR